MQTVDLYPTISFRCGHLVPAQIEATKESKTGQEAELSNIKNMIAQLHANCDFLLENYDLRKTVPAKAVDFFASISMKIVEF